MVNEVTTSSQPVSKATSRLGMLTAFIAGAFAAWILITINIEQQRAADEEEMAAVSMVAPRPVISARPAPAKSAKPAPGVTVHTSPKMVTAKPGATNTATAP